MVVLYLRFDAGYRPKTQATSRFQEETVFRISHTVRFIPQDLRDSFR